MVVEENAPASVVMQASACTQLLCFSNACVSHVTLDKANNRVVTTKQDYSFVPFARFLTSKVDKRVGALLRYAS